MTKALMAGATPKYCNIETWCRLSGMSRSGTYRALDAGHLKAVKLGKSIMVDAEAGLAWMAHLPPATIRLGKKQAA